MILGYASILQEYRDIWNESMLLVMKRDGMQLIWSHDLWDKDPNLEPEMLYLCTELTKIADVSASPSPRLPSKIDNCTMSQGTKYTRIANARGGKNPCMKLSSPGLRRNTPFKKGRTLVIIAKARIS